MHEKQPTVISMAGKNALPVKKLLLFSLNNPSQPVSGGV